MSLGLALPTGSLGLANEAPVFRYVTLGRDATWLSGAFQTIFPINSWLAPYGHFSVRAPVSGAKQGINWGRETRATLGLSAWLLGLTTVTSLEQEWRTQSTWDGTTQIGAVSGTGGRYTTLTFALSGPFFISSLESTVGLRIPLRTRTDGDQIIPNTNLFFSLHWNWTKVPTKRKREEIKNDYNIVPGEITVVDYWATWCKPCEEVNRLINSLTPKWGDKVRVIRVDVSENSETALPEDGFALPTLEVYNHNAKRTHLLTGLPEALKLEKIVEELQK